MEAKNQGIVQVRALWRTTHVIRENGELWSCGKGAYGVLFNGESDSELTTIHIHDDVKDVSGMSLAAAMIKTDGSLYSVGGFPLGNGSNTISLTPVYVTDNCKSIHYQSERFLIREDDSLWAWGTNYYNQLFVENGRLPQATPIKSQEDIVTAKGNSTTGFLVNKDNELWAVGENRYGQIGDGTKTTRLEAVKIMDDVKDVESNLTFTVALKMNGDVYTWGTGTSGALGTGNTYDQLFPVKVLENCKSIASYSSCSFGIKENGDLYGWGKNTTGQLATGNSKSQLTPMKIMENVASLSANEHVLAIKESGEVWVWGGNVNGEFGNGTRQPYQSCGLPEPFLLRLDGEIV